MKRLLGLLRQLADALPDTLPKIPPPPPRGVDFRPLDQRVADAVVDRLRREGAL